MQNNEKIVQFEQLFFVLTNFLYAAFWILTIYGFDTPYVATLTIICAVAHEVGHILILYLIGKVKIPTSRASGFMLCDSGISYIERIALCLAGPFANIALGLIALLFFFFSPYAVIFGVINLLTALSNLIPIRGSDGYNAIQAYILHKTDSYSGITALEWVSFTLICVAAFTSLYFVLRIGEGHWMCGLFLLSLAKELESIRKRRFSSF